MPNYVPGIGPFNPKLAIVAEAPGKHEDEQCIPLVGPTGSLVDDMLRSAGISRDEVYLTNVVKYRPPMNDMTKLHLINVDLDNSVTQLWEELDRVKPNAIIAMGNYSLRALLGLPMKWDEKKNSHSIMNYRGSILLAKDKQTKVIPTIHPAALFDRYTEGESSKGLDYVYKVLIEHDIKRAVDESNSRILNLPYRDLKIARNSLDLFRFLRLYENETKVASDIESINCIPVCIGFAFSRSHAISVPLFGKLGNIELSEMGDNELNECYDLINEVFRTKKIIGHNFKYDEFKLSLARFDRPTVISDTLIKTRVVFPELSDKSLNCVSSLWTREPYYKSEGREFRLGKAPVSQLLLYNARDCAVDYEVDEEQESNLDELSQEYHVDLRSYYYDYMMKKHRFYLDMENNGFAVDFAKKNELKTRYNSMAKEVHDRITESVGHEVNVKSSPQKYMLFYKEMGFKPYKKNPTAEDTIVKLMANHCKGKKLAYKKILEDVLEESRIRDQKSRYINFSPDYDGRCKTSFNISATETCRSSTGILKKPLRPRKIGLAFHTISKHGRLAKDIRSMFKPDKGKIFLQADSSQAEARVVAVLSKDWELLQAFDTIDIHRRTAALILGMTSTLDLVSPSIPSDALIGKDSPERFCGKKTRHAGNYLMGKGRFMLEFNTDAQKFEINMEVSEWKAGEMLEKFHRASPKLSSVFHADIISTLQTTRCLIDPFGGVRLFHGRMDDELYKEGFANIPQRTVAHLVQGAALRVNEELGDEVGHVSTHPVNWISENHDSLLLQVPENNWEPYARLLKLHMQSSIDFSRYCSLRRDYTLVIPCDIEISDTNYAEMRKVKI